MGWRGFTLACIVLLPALTGCFGSEAEEPVAPAIETNTTEETQPNATLPDGRGESAGLKEVNQTEEGVGGMEHLHDNWGGAETIVVFDDLVYISYFPLYPDGEGSDPRSVAYVKLPQGKLVFEGTKTVDVLVSEAVLKQAKDQPEAPHPAPPALELEYMSAADTEWRPAGALAYGTPLEIDATSKETDMPHSETSLWVFRLLTDKPVVGTQVHMTITIHKGSDVVDWPGHPDFYAETDRRLVLDTEVSTRVNGMVENILLYDQAGTWVHPEKLISWGTGHLEVFITVKEVTNDLDAAPDSYYLEYHDATIIGPEVNQADNVKDAQPPGALTDEWDFVVPVSEEGMDGPYQPHSRWGFRVRATYAGGQLCPGCFNYDIVYNIRVYAVAASPTA